MLHEYIGCCRKGRGEFSSRVLFYHFSFLLAHVVVSMAGRERAALHVSLDRNDVFDRRRLWPLGVRIRLALPRGQSEGNAAVCQTQFALSDSPSISDGYFVSLPRVGTVGCI